ncbi:MAG TPA: hypothetical protein VES91_01440, partial [Burkholderiaceae bacterium]|nr:hypothetical protein [Burkholderiaceae bacterium]
MLAGGIVSHLGGERDLLKQVALPAPSRLRSDFVAQFGLFTSQQMLWKLARGVDLLQVKFL